MVTVDDVTRELEKVVDPEIGLPITEMHLVDEITIKEDGEIFIKYHLTAPFCPPIFAEDQRNQPEGQSRLQASGLSFANSFRQCIRLTPPMHCDEFDLVNRSVRRSRK